MGIMSSGYLAPLSSQLPKNLVKNPSNPVSLPGGGTGEAAGPVDTLGSDRSAAIANQFSGTVYRAQTQQISLSARFQEVAARFSDDETGAGAAVAVQGQQFTFDFFAESRTESLTQFAGRTKSAADGLEGAQRETYLEVSHRVASRFKFSVSISGAALSGFANAADSAQGNDALWDKLMAFSNQLLDAANEAFSEFFSLFSGSVSGKPENQSQDMLRKMLDEFASSIRGMFLGGNENGNQSVSAAAFKMEVQMEFSFEASEEGLVQQSDPIVLDLNGNGFELSSYTAGAKFDLLGDGRRVNAAMVTGGDAFLAIDRNGDGAITSGKELFGDQNGAANGYEELRKLDSNGDGVINRSDNAYKQLLLWKDNGDGVSETKELISAADAGVEEISLQYHNVDWRAAGGNRIAQVSHFQWSDGRQGAAADAILNYTV